MSGIKRTLPNNPYKAAVNAINPSATNPFITKKESNLAVWILNMEDDLNIDIRAPYTMQIDSITDIYNSPTTLINLEGIPYIFGDPISLGDLISVNVDVASWIRLNVTQL